VAGCATSSGSAGHAGETANLKLTFHLAHSVGANQLIYLQACSRTRKCFPLLSNVRPHLANLRADTPRITGGDSGRG